VPTMNTEICCWYGGSFGTNSDL
jgi:hypothetical protein